MKRKIAAAILSAGLLASAAAQAGTVRFPADGKPAVTVTTPDDWSSKNANAYSEVLVAADRSATISITLVPCGCTPEEMAAEVFRQANAAPPQNEDPMEISGLRGA